MRHLSLLVFFRQNFKYEPNLCDDCHDLTQKAMNFNDVALVSINSNDYRIYFWCMSKADEISIISNSELNEKIEVLQLFFII